MSQSPNGVGSSQPMFNGKLTNAQALGVKKPQQNNFLRNSLNSGGKAQIGMNDSSKLSFNALENISSTGDLKSSKGMILNRKLIPKGKKAEEHNTKYNMNNLELNTSALRKEFGPNSNRKLPKFKVSKQNAVFRFDGESPYAEYLPALYREYKPKEKKLKRQRSNMSLNEFFRKVDKAYSDTQSVGIRHRSESRDGNSGILRKKTTLRSYKKMGTFRSVSSASSNRGGNSVRSNPARLKRKKRKDSLNDDSFLKMANLVKNRVLQGKMNAN